MNDHSEISRRHFAAVGVAAVAGLALPVDALSAQAPPPGPARTGRGASPIPRPDALKSEFLMDLILETQPSISVGTRTVVAVTGGTFEGPKLKGTVIGPGADWPMRINDTLRILDVRTLLVTDDDQKIYTTYRGVISTPQGGERYWRTTPIFETDSPQYAWLNNIVAVGVSFTVPQRVAYRIFQIL
jgi:hypothetical protein